MALEARLASTDVEDLFYRDRIADADVFFSVGGPKEKARLQRHLLKKRRMAVRTAAGMVSCMDA